MKPGTVLDNFGGTTKPVRAKATGGGLFDISRDTKFRKWRPNISRDIRETMPQWRTQALSSDALHVYTKSGGMVAAAVHGKADAVTGNAWMPIYEGENEEFKKAAEPVIQEWVNISDVRGGPHDFKSAVWLGSKTLETAGDFFVFLTYAADGVYPKLKYVEGHRVGNRLGQTIIEKGRFKGFPVSHGVVTDGEGMAIAYQVLGKDEAADQVIPARSAAHVFDPRWFSQLRGIPSLAFSILDWYDIGEIKEGEKIANKVYSKLTLLHKTPSGRAPSYQDLVDGADHTTTAGDLDLSAPGVEEISDGMIQYVMSDKDLQAFAADRPGSGWLPFMEFLIRGAIEGMDWPAELVLNKNLTGAAARSVIKRANRSLDKRRNVLAYGMRRAVLHGVSGLMELGEIPFADDWAKWGFTKAPEMSLDDGNDRKAEREDFRMGFTDRRTVIERRHSMTLERWIDRTIADEKLLIDRCAAAEIDPLRISMLTPNGNEQFDDEPDLTGTNDENENEE